MDRRSPWLRLYRVALLLLPEPVRERHGEAMTAVVADLLAEARARHGRAGAVRAAVTELLSLVRFAVRERRAALRPRALHAFDDRDLAWPVHPERSPLMLSSLRQDVRFALRMLRRSPGFTAVSIATMALAIGANTAIFSVVNGVLFKPLPFAEPERLVVVGHALGAGTGLDSTTPGNFYDWQAGTTAFTAMAAFSGTERNLTGHGTAERVSGITSAGSVFEVLGRAPLFGRTFTAAEDRPEAERVVVLSHRLWQRLYGGDRRPSARR